MRIAVGSDERTHLTDFVVAQLQERGYAVELYGALAGGKEPWPDVARAVALRVSSHQCQEGILFCWTGTGVSIAANKVPGVRAALCWDAETAQGARLWNHANVLALSLRSTSAGIAQEILDAWFTAPFGGGEDAENVAKVMALERECQKRIKE